MTRAEKLTTVAENQQKVYDAGYGTGYETGHAAGYELGEVNGWMDGKDEGYAEGKQAVYNSFWDAYQTNGNRTDYSSGFFGAGWTDETFKPKYDLQPKKAGEMFSYSRITNLVSLLEELGVTLDFSQSTDMSYVFSNAYSLKRVGVMDCSSAPNINSLFMNCYVETVGKLILPPNAEMRYAFDGSSALKDIIIEGEISYNGVDFVVSTKLTHDSLMSIINALADNSGSGTTKTCNLGTTNLAKLTDAEKAIATQKGWTLA